MKPIERLNLIDTIGRHLQETMTTTDINTYLGSFGIENDGTTMAQSKWVYVKNLLSSTDETLLIRIADDLGLELPAIVSSGSIDLKILLDGSVYIHCRQDFNRALQDAETNPASAIGMACTTLESIYKAILDEMEKPYPKDESLQSLQKAVFQEMNLSPDAHADEDIKRTLGGLINVGAGIAALRTKYSTFHGKGAKQRRLVRRHARLAVNAMSTVGLFILETYQERLPDGSDS